MRTMAGQDTSLPGCGVLRASGPDAAAFLQAQLANDVGALAPGAWQWNCYLTPQGRVQSVFPLFRLDHDVFLMAVPGELAGAVRERLVRYRLRSKLELELDSGWHAHGTFGTAAAVPDTHSAELPGARRLVLTRGSPREVEPEALARWRRADIAMGIPILTDAVADTHTPQALSLDRLAAYSVKKGCYPGQEIVARTHFLGRSKRSLARFSGSSEPAPAPSTEIASADSGEVAGSVISAAAKAERGFELLAVVREGYAGLRISGTEGALLEALPFAS